jgi:hypothetical protein
MTQSELISIAKRIAAEHRISRANTIAWLTEPPWIIIATFRDGGMQLRIRRRHA